jgi:hypothetical protein
LLTGWPAGTTLALVEAPSAQSTRRRGRQ